jgi:ligand-binding sensor domain-containing protein/signal transduction histidine kinase
MIRLRLWRSALVAGLLLGAAATSHAVILWSDLGDTLAHDTGAGSDILAGAVKRDESSTGALYFKFHVDPHSDWSTEEYFAAFQLYEDDAERLGVGNSLKAWAYSAFNTAETGPSNNIPGDFDLHSSRPEPSAPHLFFPYERVRRGVENTLVIKVQYVPGEDDLVTVWLNPDLGPGATEAGQPEKLTTTFRANASFNQIRLRHGGGGDGWTFSDMAIATSFNDFVSTGSPEPGATGERAELGSLPFTFRLWQREQGLPQNSVRALLQSHDGYIWVGNDDGVARFDGVRFVSFGLREGLPGGSARVLFEDSQGALWIGTAGGGLTRWLGWQFTTFTTQNGLPSDSITALAQDAEGRLWVGTETGLALWQNGKMAVFDEGEEFKSKAITTLHKDRAGGLWLGAAGAGVFHFTAGKFTKLSDPSVDNLLQDSHCLLEDKDGRIWLGAGDDFVLCREAGQWLRYRLPRHLARPYVCALAEEPDGTVWAGSVSEGLFQFKAGKLTALNASSGLSDNFIESLLVDHEGNLWVGTGAGLNRLRHSNLSVFSQNEGLGYGPVAGLVEAAPGLIWAAKPSDGLYRWAGRNFSRLSSSDPTQRYPEASALLVTRDGSCWVGGARGLLRFSDPKRVPAESQQLLPGLNVISLAEGRDGSLWAGTREGEVWRLQPSAEDSRQKTEPSALEPENSKPKTQNSKLDSWIAQTNYFQTHPVTALIQDSDGVLWIGTAGAGLIRCNNQVRLHFGVTNGLLSNLIRALYLDSQGVMWVGTAGGGLSRWQDGQIATFTTREGLPDNTISQIIEDNSGRLWLGSNRGLACVGKRDLDQLAAGRAPAVYPQVYGRTDGMLSEECTGGFCPAGLKTRSGLLWFSTLKGIVVADPRPQAAPAPPPPVVLEETLVDGTVIGNAQDPRLIPLRAGQSSRLNISPGKHRFEFHYTGLSFSAPDRVRFRYRLENWDPDWVEAGTRRTAPYGYVPHGQYRFEVTACNSDGVWSDQGASLALTVLPYFWQSPWFIGLAALGLLVSGGGTARLVERRRNRQRLLLLEQERALEHERARIAQDLHDDLGSSLTRISLLSDLVKGDKDNPAQVEAQAAKISQSAMQTVRALEEIVWALRPGSDSLQSLVEYIAHFANELFEGDGTRCRLDLPHDLPDRSLPPDMRHNIFLVVKEALANSLKHAAAKEVRVQAKVAANSLEIVVHDDGIGFAPQTLPAKDQRHGLGNMRRRAEAMGGSLTVESALGHGTCIKLRVNFPNHVPS